MLTVVTTNKRIVLMTMDASLPLLPGCVMSGRHGLTASVCSNLNPWKILGMCVSHSLEHSIHCFCSPWYFHGCPKSISFLASLHTLFFFLIYWLYHENSHVLFVVDNVCICYFIFIHKTLYSCFVSVVYEVLVCMVY